MNKGNERVSPRKVVQTSVLRLPPALERVKKEQQRKELMPASQSNRTQRRSVGLAWWIGLFALFGMGFCVSIVWNKHHAALSAAHRLADFQNCKAKLPITPNDLSTLPLSEIEHCDIALMNLLCAQSLPGAEGLDITNCLLTLDAWANHVRAETGFGRGSSV